MPRKKKEVQEEVTVQSLDGEVAPRPSPDIDVVETDSEMADNNISDEVEAIMSEKETQIEASIHEFHSDMTLDEIQEFVDEVSGSLSNEELLHINLEKLETVTTPIVQAVICLNRYAADNEKTIKWLNPTTAFSDAFNNLGFYSEMMKLEFA